MNRQQKSKNAIPDFGNPHALYRVEYSAKQKCFHVESVSFTRGQVTGDWKILGNVPLAELDAYIEHKRIELGLH